MFRRNSVFGSAVSDKGRSPAWSRILAMLRLPRRRGKIPIAQEFHIIYQHDAMEVSRQGSSQTMAAENSAGSRATAERATAERELSARVSNGIRIELIERGS